MSSAVPLRARAKSPDGGADSSDNEGPQMTARRTRHVSRNRRFSDSGSPTQASTRPGSRLSPLRLRHDESPVRLNAERRGSAPDALIEPSSYNRHSPGSRNRMARRPSGTLEQRVTLGHSKSQPKPVMRDLERVRLDSDSGGLPASKSASPVLSSSAPSSTPPPGPVDPENEDFLDEIAPAPLPRFQMRALSTDAPVSRARRSSVNVVMQQKSRAGAPSPFGAARTLSGTGRGPAGEEDDRSLPGSSEYAQWGPLAGPEQAAPAAGASRMRRRASLPNAGADEEQVRDELRHRMTVTAAAAEEIERGDEKLLKDEQAKVMLRYASEARKKVRERSLQLQRGPTHRRKMSSLTEDALVSFLDETDPSQTEEASLTPLDSSGVVEAGGSKMAVELLKREGTGGLPMMEMTLEEGRNGGERRKSIFGNSMGQLNLAQTLDEQLKVAEAIETNGLEISRNLYDTFPTTLSSPERHLSEHMVSDDQSGDEASDDDSVEGAGVGGDVPTEYFDKDVDELDHITDDQVMMLPWDPLSKQPSFARNYWRRLKPMGQSSLPAYQRMADTVCDGSDVVQTDLIVSRIRTDFIMPSGTLFVHHGMTEKEAESYICSQHIDRRLRLALGCYMNGTVWDTKACVTEYAFRRFLCSFGPMELLFVRGLPLLENQVIHFSFTPVTTLSPGMVTDVVSRRVQNARGKQSAGVAMSLAPNKPFCFTVYRNSVKSASEMKEEAGHLASKYAAAIGEQRVIRTYTICNVGHRGWQCDMPARGKTPRGGRRDWDGDSAPVRVGGGQSSFDTRSSRSPSPSRVNVPVSSSSNQSAAPAQGGPIDQATLVTRSRNRPSILTPLPKMTVELPGEESDGDDMMSHGSGDGHSDEQTKTFVKSVLSGRRSSRADEMMGSMDLVLEQDRQHQIKRRNSVTEVVKNVLSRAQIDSDGEGSPERSPSNSRRSSISQSRRSSRALEPEDFASPQSTARLSPVKGLTPGPETNVLAALRTGRSGDDLVRVRSSSLGRSDTSPMPMRCLPLRGGSQSEIAQLQRASTQPSFSAQPNALPTGSTTATQSRAESDLIRSGRSSAATSPASCLEGHVERHLTKVPSKSHFITVKSVEDILQVLVDCGYAVVAEHIAPFYVSALPPSFTINPERIQPFSSDTFVIIKISYGGVVIDVRFDYTYVVTGQPLKKLNPSIKQPAIPESATAVSFHRGVYRCASNPCSSYIRIVEIVYRTVGADGQIVDREYHVSGKYNIHTLVAVQRDVSHVKMELSLDMAFVVAFVVVLEEMVEDGRVGDDVDNDMRLTIRPMFALEKHFE